MLLSRTGWQPEPDDHSHLLREQGADAGESEPALPAHAGREPQGGAQVDPGAEHRGRAAAGSSQRHRRWSPSRATPAHRTARRGSWTSPTRHRPEDQVGGHHHRAVGQRGRRRPGEASLGLEHPVSARCSRRAAPGVRTRRAAVCRGRAPRRPGQPPAIGPDSTASSTDAGVSTSTAQVSRADAVASTSRRTPLARGPASSGTTAPASAPPATISNSTLGSWLAVA